MSLSKSVGILRRCQNTVAPDSTALCGGPKVGPSASNSFPTMSLCKSFRILRRSLNTVASGSRTNGSGQSVSKADLQSVNHGQQNPERLADTRVLSTLAEVSIITIIAATIVCWRNQRKLNASLDDLKREIEQAGDKQCLLAKDWQRRSKALKTKEYLSEQLTSITKGLKEEREKREEKLSKAYQKSM